MGRKYLQTSEIANAVGCHPNTVRLYVDWGYIPEVKRSKNNYRLFTNEHLEHMKLARISFSGHYPGRTLRRSATGVIKTAAKGDTGGAIEMAYSHLALVQFEKAQADMAAALLERWSQGNVTDATVGELLIGGTADLLNVTKDMLRNWESNGLIKIPRATNGYRVYHAKELGRLRVIRMLSRAGYSMMAILRMLIAFDQGKDKDLRLVLDTPGENEDIYSAADQWLSTLNFEEVKANNLIIQLDKILET